MALPEIPLSRFDDDFRYFPRFETGSLVGSLIGTRVDGANYRLYHAFPVSDFTIGVNLLM